MIGFWVVLILVVCFLIMAAAVVIFMVDQINHDLKKYFDK